MKYFLLIIFGWLIFLANGCADPRYVKIVQTTGESALIAAEFKSGYFVTYRWEKRPTDEQVGSFIFKTYRKNLGDGSPIPIDLADSVEVELLMPSMGHGSTPVTVTRLDVGTYRASEVFFLMRGEWDICFDLIDAGNDAKDRAIIHIQF